MLAPNEFVTRWGNDEPLIAVPPHRLQATHLSPDASDFLIEAGLPVSAAPYLTFSLGAETALSPVHRVWTCLDDAYSHFLIIGHTGYGDPICIDEAEGSRIVYLNHDDDLKVVFMNSSLPKFAHSLLLFREFVDRVLQEGGKDAFLKGRFPAGCWEWACREFQTADDPALDEGAFWAGELRIYD
jgi:hypothetical protein